MRLRHIAGSEDFVLQSDAAVQEPARFRGRWKEDFFRNDAPIHIEIGMGKGRFLTELSLLHPEINFLGIERYDSVLMKAIQRRKRAEKEGADFSNLSFLSIDARLLPEVFSENEISRIYLNFSDPWPKTRQKNRRLTSPVFLRIYRSFLKAEGELRFKTDNEALFRYSLESISSSGWSLLEKTEDLHRDPILSRGNVMTEYEKKFSERGNPIFALYARP